MFHFLRGFPLIAAMTLSCGAALAEAAPFGGDNMLVSLIPFLVILGLASWFALHRRKADIPGAGKGRFKKMIAALVGLIAASFLGAFIAVHFNVETYVGFIIAVAIIGATGWGLRYVFADVFKDP